jgi:hypothetical protein
VATATNLGTFPNDRRASQLLQVTLNAPAATPGDKDIVARGTLPGALGAGECALQADGLTIGFLAAEVTADCTASVTYIAFPGIGVGSRLTFGERLEADYDVGLQPQT